MSAFLDLAIASWRLPDVGWDFRWVNLAVLCVLIGIAFFGAKRHNRSIRGARPSDGDDR